MLLVTTCPVSDKHLARIREIAPSLDIRVHPSIREAADDLPQAEILLTYGEDLTPAHIERATQLKWVMVISAGLELLPFDALAARNILVTNARGIHVGPMSEYALGVMLMFSRRFVELYQNQTQRVWDRSIRIDELEGQTLGVIGAGAIGTAIAERARAFGVRTIGLATTAREQAGFDRVYDRSGLDELLRTSDFVIVIVPETPATRSLIGARELGLMKQTAVLINIARGSVVEEAALLTALQAKQLRGAALDVFVEEPLPADHPFWGLDNVVLTPHLSSRSPKYMERAQAIFRQNLEVYVSGTGSYRNLIDLTKGY